MTNTCCWIHNQYNEHSTLVSVKQWVALFTNNHQHDMLLLLLVCLPSCSLQVRPRSSQRGQINCTARASCCSWIISIRTHRASRLTIFRRSDSEVRIRFFSCSSVSRSFISSTGFILAVTSTSLNCIIISFQSIAGADVLNITMVMILSRVLGLLYTTSSLILHNNLTPASLTWISVI